MKLCRTCIHAKPDPQSDELLCMHRNSFHAFAALERDTGECGIKGKWHTYRQDDKFENEPPQLGSWKAE
jgi:hypothetical protein